MCCEDWDTDCEPEYPCKTVINHCATCSNPWDIACESDSSDGRNGDEVNDTPSCCLPCESVGRQRRVRECECEDTTCSDQTIRDIHHAMGNNLVKIEPRSAGNIQHYPRTIIDQYKARHASINGSVTVNDDHNEVCAVNEEPQTLPDDDDSQTIEIFLKAIPEDIDLTRTASGHQPDIPSWLYPITTMDVGSRDVPDVVQVTQSATPRRTQSQKSGLNDKREDLACAMEIGNKQSDGRDFAEATVPGVLGSTPSVMNAKDERTSQTPAQMNGGDRKGLTARPL
jgi:hypothetical protein